MTKSKDYVKLFEGFQNTDIRTKMVEYLDKCVKDRANIVMGLSAAAQAGTDFDKVYSYHDTIRDQIRFIELVMKNIPDTIIKQERARLLMEEQAQLDEAQKEVEALTEMV
jgi:hypothetical protein